MSDNVGIFELPEGMGAELNFGIVASRFNPELVDALVEQVMTTLQGAGVPSDNIRIKRVPGANEIPYAANMLGMAGECDCLIALGVVIAGDTNHHEVIAISTSNALQNISVELELPIINGIITTNNEEQAAARVAGDHKRGVVFANAALEMAKHASDFCQQMLEIDFDENG